MLKSYLSLGIILSLTSCASFFGNASYRYVKHTDGSCEILIDSGRNLPEGALAEVENCNLKISAPSLSQGNSQANLIALLTTLLLQNNLIKQEPESDDPR